MRRDDYGFGAFQFEPTQQLLRRAGVVVPLGRRGTLILTTLLSRRGEIVSRNALIDAAWPDAAVEDSNLSVQVSKLRRVVGYEWIITVERIGYRFAPLPPRGPERSPADGFPAVAILPISGEEADAGARRAFDDAILTALTRYKSLRLIAAPHQPVAADAGGVAQELGAQYLISGQLSRQLGGTSVISLRLIDGDTGALLSQSREAVGEATAATLAAIVEAEIRNAELSRGPRGHGPGAEAYFLFLSGRRALRSSQQHDNARAYGHVLEAVRLAPDNPTYLAAAIEVLHHRDSVGWETLMGDDARTARELAHRLVALCGDDAMPLALASQGMLTIDEGDLALDIAARAVALNPHNVLVHVCAGLANLWAGSLEAAELHYGRAVTLAPNDADQRFALAGLAAVHRLRGDYHGALALARRALAHAPALSSANWQVIVCHALLGRRDDAERALARYLRVSPGVTIGSIRRGQHYRDPGRRQSLLDGLRAAGLPER